MGDPEKMINLVENPSADLRQAVIRNYPDISDINEVMLDNLTMIYPHIERDIDMVVSIGYKDLTPTLGIDYEKHPRPDPFTIPETFQIFRDHNGLQSITYHDESDAPRKAKLALLYYPEADAYIFEIFPPRPRSDVMKYGGIVHSPHREQLEKILKITGEVQAKGGELINGPVHVKVEDDDEGDKISWKMIGNSPEEMLELYHTSKDIWSNGNNS